MFSYLVAALEAISRRLPQPVRRLGRMIGQFWSRIFFTISPSVPVDLSRCVGEVVIRRLFIIAASIGLLFSLVFSIAFSWVDGTLYGSDPGRLYLLGDRWNLLLYTVCTPVYVALATCMVVLVVQHWARMATFRDRLGGQESHGRHLGVALAIGFGLSALLITSYLRDALNPRVVRPTYWFVDVVNGVRTLNRTGYYYLLLNFGLLFITLLAIAAFFTLSVEVLRVGRRLSGGKVESFQELRDQLETFTTAYLLAKILAATYMFNAFVWKASPLGTSSNIVVAGLAITVVGVFFIAVPRLYVELKWFQYAVVVARSETSRDPYEDIRSPGVRLWAHVLDVVLIGGFVSKFWDLDAKLHGFLTWLGFVQ